ncbi:hypothetical protein BC832DRAFT_560267 [Gaertneriomyces semiglobifer]|nr:hypothetical protein BC832DRAFT_560267 [Gaertneriomyces semiglobifer]
MPILTSRHGCQRKPFCLRARWVIQIHILCSYWPGSNSDPRKERGGPWHTYHKSSYRLSIFHFFPIFSFLHFHSTRVHSSNEWGNHKIKKVRIRRDHQRDLELKQCQMPKWPHRPETNDTCTHSKQNKQNPTRAWIGHIHPRFDNAVRGTRA